MNKLITLSDQTKHILSIDAASNGTNLKKHIENILDGYVENLGKPPFNKTEFNKEFTVKLSPEEAEIFNQKWMEVINNLK